MNGRKFNWTSLYGELGSGEYEFVLSDNSSPIIKITFKIDGNGKVSFDKPTIF